jgi:hypothetical protein
VDLRVQGFYPTIEHLWETGELGHFRDLEPRGCEQFCGTSGRDELNAAGGKTLCELDNAGLVRHAQ